MTDRLQERILSLDLLRGVAVALMLFHGKKLWSQFAHSDWEGFTLYDLVYPCFLFVSGLTVSVLLTKRTLTIRSVWIRSARLFLVGTLLSSLIAGRLRIDVGTLQCIAISYGLAVTIFLAGGRKAAWWSILGIYLLYIGLMAFVRAPGVPWEQRWVEDVSFASYLDSRFVDHPRSEEGILPTLNAVTFILFGMLLGGDLLKRSVSRVRLLAQAGIALLLVGVCTAVGSDSILFVPILSRGLSPTYCLLAVTLLGAFTLLVYEIVDGRGFVRWTIPFRMLGVNALLAYCFHRFLMRIAFEKILVETEGGALPLKRWMLESLESVTGANGTDAALSGGVLLLTWGICFLLWRRKIVIAL